MLDQIDEHLGSRPSHLREDVIDHGKRRIDEVRKFAVVNSNDAQIARNLYSGPARLAQYRYADQRIVGDDRSRRLRKRHEITESSFAFELAIALFDIRKRLAPGAVEKQCRIGIHDTLPDTVEKCVFTEAGVDSMGRAVGDKTDPAMAEFQKRFDSKFHGSPVVEDDPAQSELFGRLIDRDDV